MKTSKKLPSVDISRSILSIDKINNIITTGGFNHKIKPNDFISLKSTKSSINEGIYLVKDKKGSKLILDTNYNILKEDQISNKAKGKIEKVEYKYLPSSEDEYENIKCIIKSYQEASEKYFNTYYYNFDKEEKNLRTLKDWNYFYDLYLFLKEKDYTPYPFYIQAVFEELKLMGSIKRPPYVKTLISLEYIFFFKLKKILEEKENYNLMNLKNSVRIDIGRGILECRRLKLNVVKYNNKELEDKEILVKFPQFFSKYFIFTNKELMDVFTSGRLEIKEVFPNHYENYEDLYSKWAVNQKEWLEALEERRKIEEYIDKRIDTLKEYYINDPTRVINFIANELENLKFNV